MALIAALPAAARAGVILRVDDDAGPGGDGATWPTAYRFLQDALSFASEPGNGVTEVRVAQGVYLPDRSETSPSGSGDREATFQLAGGVAVLGGYAGLGAPDPDARDIALHETVLSGDLALDDGPDFANNGENAYQVVTGSRTDVAALLEGFTITAGNANTIHFIDNGAGLYNDGGSLTVARCTFTGNNAGTNGGGMFNTNATPTVVDCVFADNAAGFGGGLANSTASPTVTGCAFVGNSASDGGGMLNIESSPQATNCLFAGNTALFEGGGMFSRDVAEPEVTNCTFVGNTAGTGGGLRVSSLSNVTLANSIVWGNSAPEGPQISLFLISTIAISHCDVEGGEAAVFIDDSSVVDWLAGNVELAPQFVDLAGADYRLGGGSPCIDAGDNGAVPAEASADLDGDTRLVDDPCAADAGSGEAPLVDMGAYEFQGKSCDLDGDGVVGTPDFLALLAAWGPCADCDDCQMDFDGDCTVGTVDFLLLLANWG